LHYCPVASVLLSLSLTCMSASPLCLIGNLGDSLAERVGRDGSPLLFGALAVRSIDVDAVQWYLIVLSDAASPGLRAIAASHGQKGNPFYLEGERVRTGDMTPDDHQKAPVTARAGLLCTAVGWGAYLNAGGEMALATRAFLALLAHHAARAVELASAFPSAVVLTPDQFFLLCQHPDGHVRALAATLAHHVPETPRHSSVSHTMR
jgi:hypothetical protein